MRSPLRRKQRRLSPNSISPAHNQRDLPAQFLFGRLPPNLRFLQLPILDAERFGRRQRYVIRINRKRFRFRRRSCLWKYPRRCAVPQRGGAFHHVNRIRIKLAGNPRLSLVLSKAEHSDARYQHNRRARIAHLRRIRRRERFVVLPILRLIAMQRRVDLLFQSRKICRRQPIDEQWPDFRANKMIRAAGSEMGQSRRVRGINKSHNFRQIGEVSDRPLLG